MGMFLKFDPAELKLTKNQIKEMKNFIMDSNNSLFEIKKQDIEKRRNLQRSSLLIDSINSDIQSLTTLLPKDLDIVMQLKEELEKTTTMPIADSFLKKSKKEKLQEIKERLIQMSQ